MRKKSLGSFVGSGLIGAMAILGCSIFSPDEVDLENGWAAWASREEGWFTGITWGNGTFVAVGGSLKTNESILFTSTDGVAWTKRLADTTQWFSSVVRTDSLFVAVGFSGLIYVSPDGVNWSAVEHPEKPGVGMYNDIVWTGNRLVLVGSGMILTSPNGLDWHETVGADDFYLNSVAWTGKQLIAVGSHGQIMTSPDGVDWTIQNRGQWYGTDFNSVEWTGSLAVATGNSVDAEGGYLGSAMATSPDGITWTKKEYDTGLCCVTWTGTRLIVTLGKGHIMTSADGVAWKAERFGSSGYSIASSIWKDGRLVAVGNRRDDGNHQWPVVFTWRP